MTYKVVANFKDLRDGHEYAAGDTYPYTGDVDAKRAEYLMTPTSQRGPLIAEAPKADVEEKPVAPKRRKKGE